MSTVPAAWRCQWPFTGFSSPVNNPPTINSANAGQAIPVKFSLGGSRGLAIFQPGYPRATAVTCASSAPIDAIEQVSTATTSGLQYDTGSGQYTYIWKTVKSMAGNCWQLQLGLIDGTTRTALFKFK